MTTKTERERIQQITDVLLMAAEGRYDTRLEFTEEDGSIGSLAEAVNRLLDRISSTDLPDNGGEVDRERYRRILDSLEESYFETDLAGNIVFFNGRALTDLGYSAEELKGLPFIKLVDKANERKVYEAFHDVYVTGRPNKGFEWEILTKNNDVIEIESSVALLRDMEGNAVGFRGVARDISVRKQTERDLQEHERKYRDVLANMEDTYLEMDLRGRFLFFNDSLCRILGYSREQLQDADYRLIAPPDRIAQAIADYNEIYTTGRPKTFLERRLVASDGSTVYLDFSMALMRSLTGEPIGFSGFGRDVTERVRARHRIEENERRLRFITRNVNDIIWSMDFDFNYTYVSPSVFTLTGFTPDEVMKIPLKMMVSPDVYAGMKKSLEGALDSEEKGMPADGEQETFFEMPFFRKDGSVLWGEVNVNFNRDELGRPFELVGVTRDITDRKQAEQELRESEEKYRTILESMEDGYWETDLTGHFTFFNDALCRLMGYTREELLGMNNRRHADPDSVERSFQIFNSVYRTGIRAELLDYQFTDGRGHQVTHELTVSLRKDADGNPVGFRGISRDVTERRRMEKALAESEQRYRMIAEKMTDLVWVSDLDLRIVYVTPSIEQVLGFTPEERMAMSVDQQLTPDSLAFGLQEMEREFVLEREGADPDRTVNLLLEYYHKDGSTRWMETIMTAIRDEQGVLTGIHGVSRDVTERKQAEEALAESEQRYRMIVENMSDMIATMDLDLRYTYVSPSVERITGYGVEHIVKTPLAERITPESLVRVKRILSDALARESGGNDAGPLKPQVFDVEAYNKKGGTTWIECNTILTRDADGSPTGILFSGRDVTGQKLAEAEKKKLEGRLIQTQKMETVGRLAGGVAHDFNNMLGVILGYVDLAKMRLVREHPVLKDIHEIEKAALRSRDITAQLLAFSRKQIIAPSVVNLNDLVVSTKKSLARLIGEHIDLRVHLEEKPWNIKFDPSQIEQILINLAVNARDAMPSGGKLTVETKNVTLDESYCRNRAGLSPGDYIQLSVSDNGTGMDREVQEHIFEPFFTTKEVGEGTGLGLSTVYGIMKQNKGFINVYSEPGYGTTFTLYLPRTDEEATDSEEDEKREEPSGGGAILLVEDDPMVLEVARGMLESVGYAVTVAKSPREAVATYEKLAGTFDLVITDVVMPFMSGADLVERLNEIHPGVKVLYMSGYTEDAVARHGVLEKGVHFLQKPFRMGDLACKVREAMKGE